jgi:hypothetical protein
MYRAKASGKNGCVVWEPRFDGFVPQEPTSTIRARRA